MTARLPATFGATVTLIYLLHNKNILPNTRKNKTNKNKPHNIYFSPRRSHTCLSSEQKAYFLTHEKNKTNKNKPITYPLPPPPHGEVFNITPIPQKDKNQDKDQETGIKKPSCLCVCQLHDKVLADASPRALLAGSDTRRGTDRSISPALIRSDKIDTPKTGGGRGKGEKERG